MECSRVHGPLDFKIWGLGGTFSRFYDDKDWHRDIGILLENIFKYFPWMKKMLYVSFFLDLKKMLFASFFLFLAIFSQLKKIPMDAWNTGQVQTSI
jgi:hypothetical protein